MREAATVASADSPVAWRAAKVTLLFVGAAWFAVAAPAAAASLSSAAASPSSKDVLQHAFAAMGGRELLARLHSLRLELRAVDYRVDDSERADGPYWLNIGIGTRWMDLDNERSRTEWNQASAQWRLQIVRIEQRDTEAVGGRWQGKWQWTEARGPLYLSVALQPQTVLATAASAADLHSLPDRILHAQWQHVLAFTYEGHEVRLYIDRLLYLPSRLEITGARSGTALAAMLGDVEWREDYLFYKRLPDGLVMPYQLNVFRNGQAYQTTVVTALQENAPAPPGGYAPPLRLSAAARSPTPWGGQPIDPKAMRELAEGVWMISGSWNVLVIRQPDGLLVVEAPQSSAYSAQVLMLLAKRFAGSPVKALISTTDSLWHIAGVRTYAARDIPIYALDANLGRLQAAIDAPRRGEPDELARHPIAARLLPVRGPLTIGRGRTRVTIYPIRGHGDERMMIVYLPGLRLLYGSSNDINLQQAPKPRATFNAFELVRRVDALELPVADYVAIHTAKIPWKVFRGAVVTQPAISSG